MRTIIKAFLLLTLAVSTAQATTWYAALPAGITCTTTNTSASIAATNTFVAGDVVYFTAVQTPFATATAYFVISTGLSGSAFEVSATYGGSAITATASGSMTAVGHSMDLIAWAATQGASCASSGTALTWGSQATGDTFNSNGCTNVYVETDPGSASVQVTLATDATNTGGSFAYVTAANFSSHYHVVATKGNGLTITGSGGGGTFNGNVTGGSAAGSSTGVLDSHTVVTLYWTGTFTAGSAANGYALSGTGPLNFTGNAISNGAYSGLVLSASGGTVTMNGNGEANQSASSTGYGVSATQGTVTLNSCIGSDQSPGPGAGCSGAGGGGSGKIVVTQSIFNGKYSAGAIGAILYAPSSATGCITYPSSSSGSLQTTCPSSVVANVTTLPPALSSSIGNLANVVSGVQYGGMTGSASGGSGVSAIGSW